jgi:hypothetical protein
VQSERVLCTRRTNLMHAKEVVSVRLPACDLPTRPNGLYEIWCIFGVIDFVTPHFVCGIKGYKRQWRLQTSGEHLVCTFVCGSPDNLFREPSWTTEIRATPRGTLLCAIAEVAYNTYKPRHVSLSVRVYQRGYREILHFLWVRKIQSWLNRRKMSGNLREHLGMLYFF